MVNPRILTLDQKRKSGISMGIGVDKLRRRKVLAAGAWGKF